MDAAVHKQDGWSIEGPATVVAPAASAVLPQHPATASAATPAAASAAATAEEDPALGSIAFSATSIRRIARSAVPGARFSSEAIAALHRVAQAYVLYATDRALAEARPEVDKTKKGRTKAPPGPSPAARRLTGEHVMRFLSADLPPIASKISTLFPNLVPSEFKPAAVTLLEQLREQDAAAAAAAALEAAPQAAPPAAQQESRLDFTVAAVPNGAGARPAADASAAAAAPAPAAEKRVGAEAEGQPPSKKRAAAKATMAPLSNFFGRPRPAETGQSSAAEREPAKDASVEAAPMEVETANVAEAAAVPPSSEPAAPAVDGAETLAAEAPSSKAPPAPKGGTKSLMSFFGRPKPTAASQAPAAAPDSADSAAPDSACPSSPKSASLAPPHSAELAPPDAAETAPPDAAEPAPPTGVVPVEVAPVEAETVSPSEEVAPWLAETAPAEPPMPGNSERDAAPSLEKAIPSEADAVPPPKQAEPTLAQMALAAPTPEKSQRESAQSEKVEEAEDSIAAAPSPRTGDAFITKVKGRYFLSAGDGSRREGVYTYDRATGKVLDREFNDVGTFSCEPVSMSFSECLGAQANAEMPHIAITDSEIMTEIQKRENAGAFFVLPSQLNGAEYPSHELVVREIEKYKYDNTGGPRGQLAVHPAAGQFVLDNAACHTRKDGINAIDEILARTNEANIDFELVNGYLKMPEPRTMDHSERAREAFVASLQTLRVLMMEGVPASGLVASKSKFTQATHRVSLVYASAVPLQAYVNYAHNQPARELHKQIAEAVLVAQYLGALQTAAQKATGWTRGKIFLMPLGGGVFNNPWETIVRAMSIAVEMLTIEELARLDIRVLTWNGNPNERGQMKALLSRHGKLRTASWQEAQ